MTKLNLKVVDMENSIVDFAKNVSQIRVIIDSPIANPHRFRESP